MNQTPSYKKQSKTGKITNQIFCIETPDPPNTLRSKLVGEVRGTTILCSLHRCAAKKHQKQINYSILCVLMNHFCQKT